MLQEIADNGIKIYQFPDAELDEEDDAANQKLRVSLIYTGYLILLINISISLLIYLSTCTCSHVCM